MRRHMLHVAVALFAFTAGFLAGGPREGFLLALAAAAVVFLLAKVVYRFDFDDLYSVCLIAMSLLFWSAGFTTLLTFMPDSGSCTLEFSDDYKHAHAAVSESRQAHSDSESSGGITALACAGAGVDHASINSIWAGMIDGKALKKPAPALTQEAKEAKGARKVSVAVLVDESGRVVWAQAIAGNRLLKHPAAEAACKARFYPTLVNGPPIRVSGVLTYDFGP
jgi:hypothetical protein